MNGTVRMHDSRATSIYRALAASFVLILVAASASFGQAYPRWFLDPGDLSCRLVAAGFSTTYYHSSSSDSVAFVDACSNLSSRHYMELTGGEAYWTTEAGVAWMGNDFSVKTDTVFFRSVLTHGKKLDSCVCGQMTMVLVGEGECDISDSMRALVECPASEPDWVENIPQGGSSIYAEGVAPLYYYESSSWESAEKNALFNLARSIKVSMEALQKMNGGAGQEIKNEQITVTLRNVQVVRRWRDIRRGLCYVLVRMPMTETGGGN